MPSQSFLVMKVDFVIEGKISERYSVIFLPISRWLVNWLDSDMSLYATAEITSLIQTTNCLMKGIRNPNSPFQICIYSCLNLSEEIRIDEDACTGIYNLFRHITDLALVSMLQYAKKYQSSCHFRVHPSHLHEIWLWFPVCMQASDDAESVGNCPFCQRLFMILWLKGINFTLTTVDMRR